MELIKSFFDKNYRTPLWFKEKKIKERKSNEQQNINRTAQQNGRRNLLKSAAGLASFAVLPLPVLSQSLAFKNQKKIIQSEPWLTINNVLDHLLPASDTGPSAMDIHALDYLYNIMYVQPTEQDEKDFILKGVGWLNGYAHSQLKKPFIALSFDEKETILRGISGSRAGENWLSTLIGYIFEAMLAPPSYGGNPEGIGWKWLEHQAGFPLPKAGGRYYELPGQAKIKFSEQAEHKTKLQEITVTAFQPNRLALIEKGGKA